MNDLMNLAIPLWALAAYMVFMCAVQSMPRPAEKTSPGYTWFYRFAHLLCCNLALFIDPTKKIKMAAAPPDDPPGGG